MGLKENCSRVKESINKSIEWLKVNVDSSETKSKISELKFLKREARNLESVADGNPTLAIFGESQIGKSYFMSELLKNKEENRFFVTFKSPSNRYDKYVESGNLVNFLTHINPDGAGESSGIVTRFSISSDKQLPNGQVPVKFLRQIDIATILIDTYSLDVTSTSELNDIDIDEVINVLKELNSEKEEFEIDGMVESDVIDFKEYLNKYLKEDSPIVFLFNKNRVWDDIIEILPRVPYDLRYKLFELFWGRVSIFTELFNHLSNTLKEIDFEIEANLELSALLPKAIGVRKNSVIDVRTLEDLFNRDKLEPIKIITKKGEFSNFLRGEITALLKEVILTVDNRILKDDNRKFINSTDVLDFPGARPRMNLDVAKLLNISSFKDLEKQKLDDNILYMCLVRGKVSFLFNHYSDMNDITTLIFAQKNSNQNTHSLPRMIDNWVINTHGSSPEERANKPINLFISFHFFNIELNGQPSDRENDSSCYDILWEARFKYNIEDFLGGQLRAEDNWILNWANGKPFQNFFFLRDPKKEFNRATTIKDGKEVYNEGYEEKHKYMKQSFINHKLVRKYVKNPSELWDNSASLNHTGAEYIIKNIQPVTTKERRYQQLNDKLQIAIKNSLNIIKHYYIGGDYQKALKEAMINGKKSIYDITIALKKKNSFGNFLDSFMLSEDLTWKSYYNFENPIYTYDKKIVAKKEIEDKPIIDIDINTIIDSLDINFEEFGEEEEKKEEITNIEDKKSKSQIFSEIILNNWEATIRDNLKNEALLKELAIKVDTYSFILQELLYAFNRLKFKEFLSKSINDEVEKYIEDNDYIYLIAKLTTHYINSFINCYGWNHEELNRRPDFKNRKLFSSIGRDSYIGEPIEPLRLEDIKLETKFAGEEFVQEWLKAFFEAIKANLQYKYSGEGIKNPEANTILGEIIKSLKEVKE